MFPRFNCAFIIVGRVLQLGIQLEQRFDEVAIVCTRKGGIWSEVVSRDDEHIRILDIPRQLRRVEEAVVQHQGHVEPTAWIWTPLDLGLQISDFRQACHLFYHFVRLLLVAP